MNSKWALLVGAVLLASCSALPQKDLQNQYLEMTRNLGLTPLYPPREELQVGDVFFASYDKEDENNIRTRSLIYIGTLKSVREHANQYMLTRINYVDTVRTTGQGKDTTLADDQSDFSAGVVALNNGERTTLPIVTFPVITGAASTGASLGAFDFAQSFSLGFGNSENVSIDFKDTRAFGAPIGPDVLVAANDFFGNGLCLKTNNAMRLALQQLDGFGIAQEQACGDGRVCQVKIVTRTFRTRNIDYVYKTTNAVQLAAAQLRGTPAQTPTTTLPVPATVNVDVTLGQDNDGAQLQNLVDALNANSAAPGSSTEQTGLNFVGLQGNGLKFRRTLRKPVAIAYESLDYSPETVAKNCRS